MKIPKEPNEREAFYVDLITRCFASREDRKNLYSVLKNYYLYGNQSLPQAVDYNKLYAHIDLLSSFLFSGETTAFVIETSVDSDSQDPITEQRKAQVILPKVVENWHDSNLDILFNEALNWALVYSTMFIKLVPYENARFGAYLVEPQLVGVLREDVPMLDNQECVCHEFYMGESEFKRRIEKFGEEEKTRIMNAIGGGFSEVETGGDTLPLPVAKLIVTATNPQTGGVQGQMSNVTATYDMNPKINEKVLVCHELMVYDDDAQDYRMVLMADGKVTFFDAMENTFVPNELPLIKITPNMIANYFWGKTELMHLIPLQEWMNTRVQEIRRVLAKIADPPLAGIGMSGVVEEKWLENPGDRIATDIPSGNILNLFQAQAGDLFAELKMIETMFDEVSGIRELMQGKGEKGVRATSHADLLVRVGSSRVKKKAAILEDSVEKVGSLILAFMRKYDPTHYELDEPKGYKFTAKMLSSRSAVKVDSHSSSPIFIDQQMDKAEQAFKAGAIDKEDLIDMMRFQNSAYMKSKLHKREEENNKLNAIAGIVNEINEQNMLQMLEKLKKMTAKPAKG